MQSHPYFLEHSDAERQARLRSHRPASTHRPLVGPGSALAAVLAAVRGGRHRTGCDDVHSAGAPSVRGLSATGPRRERTDALLGC